MLSSLPKLADRNFIIGFFVPTLLTALVILWLFRDIEAVQLVYEAVWKEKKWEEITVFALGVWVFAMLLMLLNHQIYRMTEGYTGPLAWRGNRRMSEKRDALTDERRKLIVREETETDPSEKRRLGNRIDAIDLELARHFPPPDVPALPSRFGNAIRAFESYPIVVYGVDSIPAWFRLAAVIPKPLASAAADARAEVDFFLNTFALSLLLAAIALGRFLWNVPSLEAIDLVPYSKQQWPFLACIIVFVVIARLAYNGAVARAVAWGEHVKSAFDLYLPKLAETLGYRLPDTLEQRRRFWATFNLMALYSQSPMDPLLFPTSKPVKPENAAENLSAAEDDEEEEPDDEKV